MKSIILILKLPKSHCAQLILCTSSILANIERRVSNMRQIASNIRQHEFEGKQRKEYSVFFVPRRTLICEKVLEEEGVKGGIFHFLTDFLIFYFVGFF